MGEHLEILRQVRIVPVLSRLRLLFRRIRQREPELRSQQIAHICDIRDPVADVLVVGRLSWYHLRLKAIGLERLHHLRKAQEFRHRHIRLDRRADFLDDVRQARQDLRREYLGHDGLHELLLAPDAPDVALAVAVAHVLDGLLAVHVLLTRIEVDDEASVVIPGVLIMHALLDVDVDAADGIDDTLKGLRVDDDIVVHRHAEQALDGLLRELMTAVRIGVIDLIVAMPIDCHARIARD